MQKEAGQRWRWDPGERPFGSTATTTRLVMAHKSSCCVAKLKLASQRLWLCDLINRHRLMSIFREKIQISWNYFKKRPLFGHRNCQIARSVPDYHQCLKNQGKCPKVEKLLAFWIPYSGGQEFHTWATQFPIPITFSRKAKKETV